MKKITTILIALVALVAAFAIPTTASASSVAPIISVESASVGSFEFNLSGTILEDVRMSYKGTNYKKCKWVKGGWNSGRGVDGQLYYFWDPVRAYICRSRKSPTGWIKVKGGKTGRKCGNPWKPKGKPKRVVKNVTLVRSFSKFKINVSATASAKVSGRCPSTDVSGEATATSNVSVVINMTMLIRAKGSSSALRVIVEQELKGQGIAEAKANLKLTCISAPPPPGEDVPPQISCVYPAHVFTGGNVMIWCEAFDPDGDAVSINVISDNASGHISGTIVNTPTTPVPRYDGAPCPTGITCSRSSFWGDMVGTARVTATVTANGKSSTSVGVFPVLDGNTGF